MLTHRLCSTLCLAAAFTVGDAAGAGAATIVVRAGENLQSALNAAQPGDVITLEAGATFTGNFVLPVKTGSAVHHGAIVRARLAVARRERAHEPVVCCATAENPIGEHRAGAARRGRRHHWRLLFLEFPSTQLGYNDIVRIGEGSSAQSTLAQVPYEIEIDRVYVHGDPLYGQKRGIALNGRSVTIRNSYISDIKAVGFDTQAIGGWNGPGPFTIENNYLEAAGENFILGGSDPAIPNLVSERRHRPAQPHVEADGVARSRDSHAGHGRRGRPARRRRAGGRASIAIASSRAARSAVAPSDARPPRSKRAPTSRSAAP